MCYGRGDEDPSLPAPGSWLLYPCLSSPRWPPQGPQLCRVQHHGHTGTSSTTTSTILKEDFDFSNTYTVKNLKQKYNCCRTARLPVTRSWRLWTERCLPTPARTQTASTAAPAGAAAEVSILKEHSRSFTVPGDGRTS